MKSHKSLIRQLNGACAFFLLSSLSNCTGSQSKPEKQFNPAPIELYRGINDVEKAKSANLILDEANELEENKKYLLAQKMFRELDSKFGEYSYIPSESESFDEDAGGISYHQITQRRLSAIECKINKKSNGTMDIRRYADNLIEAIRLINKDDIKRLGACEISLIALNASPVKSIEDTILWIKEQRHNQNIDSLIPLDILKEQGNESRYLIVMRGFKNYPHLIFDISKDDSGWTWWGISDSDWEEMVNQLTIQKK